MTIRSKYHKQLRRLMGDTIIDKETIHLLQQANIDVMAWYNEWEAILCASQAFESGSLHIPLLIVIYRRAPRRETPILP